MPNGNMVLRDRIALSLHMSFNRNKLKVWKSLFFLVPMLVR